MAKSRKSSGSPSSPTIGRPPVIRKVTPRNSTIVPSVAMNGLTSSRVTISPLTSPTSAPTATPAATPATMPASSIAIAVTQPDSATTDPTLRSKPPQMIT